jgi:hypothetical protein
LVYSGPDLLTPTCSPPTRRTRSSRCPRRLLRGFDGEAAARKGTASGAPITVRALAYIIAGHVAHHLDILRTRYSLA